MLETTGRQVGIEIVDEVFKRKKLLQDVTYKKYNKWDTVIEVLRGRPLKSRERIEILATYKEEEPPSYHVYSFLK